MSQVDFFNSIAENWDNTIKVDKEKINKLLSQISITSGDSILDVGTGTGVLIPFYKEINKDGKITGVDISEGMLNVAERKFGQLSNVNFNSNLQIIGAMAFADNNLTSLDLPSGLQSIGEKAFISNQFPHAYAVNLGPNTQWSKDWLTCPFSCFDNSII